MQQLKINKIGDSLGVILSAEILEKLRVGEGDIILAIETTDGIKIVANDPAFEAGMLAYERVAAKYTNALHELAK
jgi:putative addiction module antidote